MAERGDEHDAELAGSDDDDFWDDDLEGRRGRKRSSPAIPIVAGAAALLLIVVIFVVARNASDSEESQGPESATDGGSPDGGSDSGPAVEQWTRSVVGSPEVFSGAEPAPDAQPGVYVWVDFDGWHLRVVKGEGVGQVSGEITGSDEPILKGMVAADPSAATVEGKVLRFDLPAEGKPITGFDFSSNFYGGRIVLRAEGPDGLLPRDLILTGSNAEPAGGNPAIFQRSTRT